MVRVAADMSTNGLDTIVADNKAAEAAAEQALEKFEQSTLNAQAGSDSKS